MCELRAWLFISIMSFVDDFRLTAASSLLKILVSRHIGDSGGDEEEKILNGQLPPLGMVVDSLLGNISAIITLCGQCHKVISKIFFK